MTPSPMTTRMTMRWVLAWVLATAGALVAHAAGAVESAPTVPVAFGVAVDEGEPVRDGAWIADQLARADALFAEHGVRFKSVGVRTIGAEHAHVLTRADRDDFARLLLPQVINVFVVAGLADVDEALRFRSGVHWRASEPPGARYILLSAAAPSGVLAHELGHYFGNPHSPVPDNIMSYTRTGSRTPFFDARQDAMIREQARRVIATGEIVPFH